MNRRDPLAFLEDELADLARRDLLRRPNAPSDPEARSFCSNDYLGLAGNPPPPTATGAGASRLVSGERHEHGELERAFASWLGLDAALAFTSGWAANVGAVSALARRGDLVVSDELNHASLIDGARLSRARVVVTPHADVSAVASALARRSEPRAWVLVESYYSMDADGPDLVALRRTCDEHAAALLVDEAHALGVLGPSGRGLCAAAGVRPDVLVGTLGKAFGSQGAFVAGPRVLRDWLWNRARSFVFSTGLSPAAAAAGVRALRATQDRPNLARRVAALAERLRRGLVEAGAQTETTPRGRSGAALLGFGHIVPVVIGSAGDALRVANAMRARGVEVQAIRPPTVPDGTARIRMTVTARHSESDVDRAVDAFAHALQASDRV